MADAQTTTIIAPTRNITEALPEDHFSMGIYIFQLVYIFVVAIATIVINGLTLYAIYKDPLKCFRNPLTIFITGVLAADFLTGLLGEPLIASGVAHLWLTGNEAGLRVLILGMVVAALTLTVSFLTLLALAICQLLAIGWVRRYEGCVSIKSAKIGIAVIWVSTLFVCVALGVLSHIFFVVVLMMLVVCLVTIVLVILYIVTYFVFRKRVGRQDSPLESNLVNKEFLKATFLLVLVQIVTVWPYVVATTAAIHIYDFNVEVVRAICTVLFLSKFVIDPIILVWRIPKYSKSLKIVYASCLARCGCCAVDMSAEGRAVAYNETRHEDFDEQENVNVEVI